MRRGQTLAATLIVIAIIGILAAAYFLGTGAFGGQSQSARPDGKGKTVVGAAKLEATDEVCRNNLRQLRAAIEVASAASAEDPPYPTSLEETRIGAAFYSCPIGKERYNYDPTQGTVQCPHPGHENY